MTLPVLHGLVLAGGESRRMGRDKAALEIDGRSALERAVALVRPFCRACYVSVRPGSVDGPRSGFDRIEDCFGGVGPADGIASAQAHSPDAAWMVIACDLPNLDAATLTELVRQRDASCDATAFRSLSDKTLPEPLCAIYEPASQDAVLTFLQEGMRCPRKMLLSMNTRLLDQPTLNALDNVNTPADWQRYNSGTDARR